MSALMRSYVAGLLAHASEITCFLAPNINSYKRFAAGTFAPTKAVWSTDNRTAGYRLVGADSASVRIECRVGGADLNPYLAFAAQLAAGIAGIEAGLELEPEFTGDAYRAARAPRDPEDPARRHRGAAPLDHAPRRLRRRGGRPLRPRRPLGAVRIRPRRHRLGDRPRLRAGLREAMTEITCISPVDGSIYATRPVEPIESVRDKLAAARAAQRAWAARPLDERIALVREGVARLDRVNADLVTELAWQMGRPVRYGGEMGGVRERTAYMAEIAAESLAPKVIEDSDRFRRFLAREPLGLVLVIAPWNYPFLTAINTIVPGLIAGNAIVLKHASQTPLAGERLAQAFAHLPDGALHQPLPRPRDHRRADRRAGLRLHQLHRQRARRPGDRARRRRHLRRPRPRARRQGPGLRPRRRQPRRRRRHADGRRHVQRRPVLLRHRAHLRPREPLRALRRRRPSPGSRA